MVEDIEGVVKLGPVPKDVPPVGELYQLMVPELAVAPSNKVPASQRELGLVPVIVGKGLITRLALLFPAVEQPLAGTA